MLETAMEASDSAPSTAPVLSTPDTNIFDTYTPAPPKHSKLSAEELSVRYEVQRTADAIRSRKWRRIALQFPDLMLPDAPRVVELLRTRLRSLPRSEDQAVPQGSTNSLEHEVRSLDLSAGAQGQGESLAPNYEETFYILGDTSYGSCCVDEIAAEHASADAVVHYGRACLSPTARLPVLHVFTIQALDHRSVIAAFESAYPDKASKVLLAADVTYSSHVPSLGTSMRDKGYSNVFVTSIVHEPSSAIPNRTIPPNLPVPSDGASPLQEWSLFYVSQPPSSLLLTLASRVSSIHIYPVDDSNATPSASAVAATSLPLLRRRYGLLTRLRTAAIIGILINTLSVRSTLGLVSRLRRLIAARGKKSYTVVVGKVNAAKLANFAEVDGWVVVGCWESSLLDDPEGKGGAGWWKPCVTPWELHVSLAEEGAWRGNWNALVELDESADPDTVVTVTAEGGEAPGNAVDAEPTGDKAGSDGSSQDATLSVGPLEDEEESEPPEFDLRTGRYVSNSRPMRVSRSVNGASVANNSRALTRRARGDLAVINGEASPGAAFLRNKRTWRGLGSDFEIAYEEEKGGQIEEGRSGLARGYAEERQP